MNHLLALTALVTAALDLGFKLMHKVQDQVLIPSFLAFTKTQNTGVAFGLFAAQPFVTLICTALIILLLGVFLRVLHFTRLEEVCLGLMLGGALGNLVDRVLHGAISDYLEILLFAFPVFNLADIALVTGASLLLVYWLFSKKGSLL